MITVKFYKVRVVCGTCNWGRTFESDSIDKLFAMKSTVTACPKCLEHIQKEAIKKSEYDIKLKEIQQTMGNFDIPENIKYIFKKANVKEREALAITLKFFGKMTLTEAAKHIKNVTGNNCITGCGVRELVRKGICRIHYAIQAGRIEKEDVTSNLLS